MPPWPNKSMPTKNHSQAHSTTWCAKACLLCSFLCERLFQPVVVNRSALKQSRFHDLHPHLAFPPGVHRDLIRLVVTSWWSKKRGRRSSWFQYTWSLPMSNTFISDKFHAIAQLRDLAMATPKQTLAPYWAAGHHRESTGPPPYDVIALLGLMLFHWDRRPPPLPPAAELRSNLTMS